MRESPQPDRQRHHLLIVLGLDLVQEPFGLIQFDLGDRISQEVDRLIMGVVASLTGLITWSARRCGQDKDGPRHSYLTVTR